MYSFANRPDCTVVDEPFYAHYLKETGADHPGREEILSQHESDFRNVLEHLIFADTDTEILFLKNMPHHMVNCSMDFVEELSNFFLVREPRAMIASFIKKIPDVSMTDLGLKRQWELYADLCAKGHNPPIVDSADLLKNPRQVLSDLCGRLSIPFEETMLTWNAGPIKEDGVWAKYWYANVHASKGWSAQQSTARVIPAAHEHLAQECEKYYNLFKQKT
jgi:hypothetical protein